MTANLFTAGLSFAAGMAAGLAFCAMLDVNVGLYLNGGTVKRALAFQILRLLGISAAFIALATVGAGELVSAMTGFLLARPLYLKWPGRRA